jgi:hypothetical protein
MKTKIKNFIELLLYPFYLISVAFHEVGHYVGSLCTGNVPDFFHIDGKSGCVGFDPPRKLPRSDSLMIAASGPIFTYILFSFFAESVNFFFSFFMAGSIFYGFMSAISFAFLFVNAKILIGSLTPNKGIGKNGKAYKTDGRRLLEIVLLYDRGPIRNFLARLLMFFNRKHFKRNLNPKHK